MMKSFVIDDCELEAFAPIVSAFGRERFGYVVTPNVDHLIRFHDDARFRSAYNTATYAVLDSRVLSRLFRLAKGVHVGVCTGSDLTAQCVSGNAPPG